MLCRNPELGERRYDLGPELRCFALGTYVIIYRTAVEIARVISGYRDLDALF